MPPRLDPRIDLVFKALLTREPRLLRSMLEAILDATIDDFTILNPEIPGPWAGNRSIVLDLRVRLASGARIDVEMQIRSHPGLIGRLVNYGARDFSDRCARGGDDEPLTPTVIVIWLGKPLLEPHSRLHFHFAFRERDTGELLTDLVGLHFLQFAACADPSASSDPPSHDILLRWARFLAAADLETFANEDPIVTLAKDTLDHLSADPDVARAAREREDALRLYRMDLDAARNIGRLDGRQEGRLEAARGMTRALVIRRFGALSKELDAHIDLATIAALQRLQLESADAPTLDAALQRAGWHDLANPLEPG